MSANYSMIPRVHVSSSTNSPVRSYRDYAAQTPRDVLDTFHNDNGAYFLLEDDTGRFFNIPAYDCLRCRTTLCEVPGCTTARRCVECNAIGGRDSNGVFLCAEHHPRAWCAGCQKELPKSDLARIEGHWRGEAGWCPTCREEEERWLREENERHASEDALWRTSEVAS